MVGVDDWGVVCQSWETIQEVPFDRCVKMSERAAHVTYECVSLWILCHERVSISLRIAYKCLYRTAGIYKD